MKTLFRLLKYGRQWRWMFIVSIIAVLLATATSLALPIAVRELLSVLIDESGGDGVPSVVWTIVGVLFGIYVVQVFFQFADRYFNRRFSVHLLTKLRCDLYSHMQTLSPRFYHDKQVGQIINRLLDNTRHIPTLIGALLDFVTIIVTVVGVIVILFIVNPLLALVALAPLPILFIVSVIQREMRKYWTRAKAVVGELYGTMSDNIQGMKEIQVFNKQEYEDKRHREINDKINADAFRAISWSASLKPLMGFLQALGTILIIGVGSYLAFRGRVDVADIVLFVLFVGILYGPVARLASVVEEYTDVLTDVRRTFEYVDAQSEVKEREGAVNIDRVKGDIEFKNVTFAYKGENNVLCDISFKANSGTMVALVGETGAGKTTIGSLIARLYELEYGSIMLDGVDIRDMTLKSLRDQISIVFQDVYLFNGTIAENIAYGCAVKPSHDEIVKASQSAQIHNFVDGLPEKYDTKIGERGVRLSGGQKQRLSIARALLRNTPILILDEATSSIDNTTEKYIQTAIDELSKDKSRTILVIAHRLSTIEKADNILYIKGGKVAEQGTHDELLKRGGHYANLRKSM